MKLTFWHVSVSNLVVGCRYSSASFFMDFCMGNCTVSIPGNCFLCSVSNERLHNETHYYQLITLGGAMWYGRTFRMFIKELYVNWCKIIEDATTVVAQTEQQWHQYVFVAAYTDFSEESHPCYIVRYPLRGDSDTETLLYNYAIGTTVRVTIANWLTYNIYIIYIYGTRRSYGCKSCCNASVCDYSI